MKTIMIACNDSFALYTFRLNLIKYLANDYKIIGVCNVTTYKEELDNENLILVNIPISSTSTSIIDDIKIINIFRKLHKKYKPDILINYTVKPHVYSTLMKSKKTKVINVVTGVGSAFLHKNLVFFLIKYMYRFIKGKVDAYIFLNYDDYADFKKNKLILKNKVYFLNSEGIDTNKFYSEGYNFQVVPTFIFVGRMVMEKGINEYLEAAKIIKEKYDSRFLIAGEIYNKKSVISGEKLENYINNGIVEYLGFRKDIEKVLKEVDCLILPSYREGMPISIIEAMAAKKCVIASNVTGIKEIINDNINGLLVKKKDVNDLVEKIEYYIKLDSKLKLEIHKNAYLSSQVYDYHFVNLKYEEILGEI